MENKNNYLIPANSKKSQLILGFFNGFDLTLLLVGLAITVILLLVIDSNDIGVMLLLASPALFAIFLVLPVPHYHNVMTLIGNIYRFYTGRKKYYWRGWCVSYGNNRNK
jgi:hypothetical protein